MLDFNNEEDTLVLENLLKNVILLLQILKMVMQKLT